MHADTMPISHASRAGTHDAPIPAAERVFPLDYVKAAAIVGVAATHAVPGLFDRPPTAVQLAVYALTAFHVPSFLFVSGFLATTGTPVGPARVAERLRRLLVPYLIASGCVWASGLATVPSLWKLPFRLVMGSMLGHYYFVPVLAFCFLLLPVLSRMTRLALGATIAVLFALTELRWVNPAWWLTRSLFWSVRDPVLQFHLGFFALGILTRPGCAHLGAALAQRHAVVATCTVAIAAGFAWIGVWYTEAAAYPIARIAYTLAVMATIAAFTRDRPPPPLVRFLSEATLTLYLYHWLAYPALEPFVDAAPLPLRMIVLMSAGLAFGSLVAVGGRRILGERSRLLLGY